MNVLSDDFVLKVYIEALRTSVFIAGRCSPLALADWLASGELAVLLEELTLSVFVNSAPVSCLGPQLPNTAVLTGTYTWVWTPISPMSKADYNIVSLFICL